MQGGQSFGERGPKKREKDRVGQEEHEFKERDWTIAVSAVSSDELQK